MEFVVVASQDSRMSVLHPMPECRVCGGSATGIHFGADACFACAAFFRRCIAMQKTYICLDGGQCQISVENQEKCRGCRFNKCIAVGMNPKGVKFRRDAIGKYSTSFPSSSHTDSGVLGNNCSSDASVSSVSSKLTFSVLSEMEMLYDRLQQDRRIMYAREEADMLDNSDLRPRELDSFSECMTELYNVEPRLYLFMSRNNRTLRSLAMSQIVCILKNFHLSIQAIEEPYLTWQFAMHTEGDSKRYWMMLNRRYIDFAHVDQYFDGPHEPMKGLNMQEECARRLFQPSFLRAMDVVGARMADLNVTLIEVVFLLGLALYDPTISGLTLETKKCLLAARNQLMNDMMTYYVSIRRNEPEVRFADLIHTLSGVKEQMFYTNENLEMMRTFKIIPDLCPI